MIASLLDNFPAKYGAHKSCQGFLSGVGIWNRGKIEGYLA